MTQPLAQAVLTPENQAFFEQQGYLLVEDALPADVLAALNAATDELYARDADAGRLEKSGKLNMRNCIVEHPAFLQLLDWPATVPLAWQLLGWNIQMLTSHLIVLPSGDEPAEDAKNKLGWHRDGGTSPRDMSEPHPDSAQNSLCPQRPNRPSLGGHLDRARVQPFAGTSSYGPHDWFAVRRTGDEYPRWLGLPI